MVKIYRYNAAKEDEAPFYLLIATRTLHLVKKLYFNLGMSNFLNARDILNSQKTKEYGKTKKECSFSLKSVINYNNFVYNCIVLEGCRLASYYC